MSPSSGAPLSSGPSPDPGRPGPKTRKKYLLVACTSLLTYYYLGERSLESFGGFVLEDLSGSVGLA
jgi:hypothetical protein